MPTADDWRKFNQSLIEEIRVIERKVSGWSQTELTTMYYRSPKL